MMHSLNLSWFEGNNLRLRPGFLQRIAWFGHLDLLETVGDQNCNFFPSNFPAIEFLLVKIASIMLLPAKKPVSQLRGASTLRM